MIDCLIIGFNDANFEDYVKMVRSMGTDSGAYRDLDLAFVEYDNKPYRSMDILNHFHFQNKQTNERPFSNVDFLWPVVTYLGTYLSRRGFSFDYINLFHLEKEQLREKLERNDIRTIAITTTLYVSAHPILEMVSFIREHNRTAKIIIGGPYISGQAKVLDPPALKDLFKYLGADIYIINQEGELALANTLTALKQNTSLDRVDNIAYRQGDTLVTTATSIESNPLEENMVDYTLFPKAQIDQFVSTRTAKSCPFACAFCGFPQRAGKYKYTGVELVEQELDALREVGSVTTLTFIDDTFNVPKQRFKDILRMMIRNRYDLKWNCFYRSDHGDDETIALMAEAGCEGVFLGVEAGSDTMLAHMNKSARRKDYMHAIPLLREAGISTYASLIVGFPGETYETVQETIDFIEESQPEFFRAQLWYCDPLTPIWEKRDEHGIKGSAFNWSHNTMDSKTACDLIEKMFLSVENSIWLPQFGFEQWSTFYLQRRGMSREQLRNFLKCFNAVKREQLLHPQRKEITPALLESLKTSCRFDEPVAPDMRPVVALTGARYAAAEKFWMQTFGNGSAESILDLIRTAGTKDDDDAWATLPLRADAAGLDLLRTAGGGELSTSLIAAFSLLLSRVSGRKETTIIAAQVGSEETHPLPLKLYPQWGLNFGEFAADITRLMPRALEYQRYGLHLLTNPVRLAEYGCAQPVFDVAFLSGEGDEALAGKAALDDALKLHPDIADGVGLVLQAVERDGQLNLHLHYRESWFGRETAGQLASCLELILEAVARNPLVLLGDVVLDEQANGYEYDVESDANALYQF